MCTRSSPFFSTSPTPRGIRVGLLHAPWQVRMSACPPCRKVVRILAQAQGAWHAVQHTGRSSLGMF